MQQMRMVLVVLKFGLIEVNSHCLTQAFHVWNRRFLPLVYITIVALRAATIVMYT